MTFVRMLAMAGFVLTSLSAMAEELPATATKATPDEFKQFADGKTLAVDILDLKQPVTATLVWNWTDQTISGTALIDGRKEVDFKFGMGFDGEKACAKGRKKSICYLIYIDRDAGKFYEVRDDGRIHAVSTIKS